MFKYSRSINSIEGFLCIGDILFQVITCQKVRVKECGVEWLWMKSGMVLHQTCHQLSHPVATLSSFRWFLFCILYNSDSNCESLIHCEILRRIRSTNLLFTSEIVRILYAAQNNNDCVSSPSVPVPPMWACVRNQTLVHLILCVCAYLCSVHLWCLIFYFERRI